MSALPTHTVEKVWGREELPAPFTNDSGNKVGEIWFDPPAALPDLLVKYLFTSEKLSVQVHPNDDQAPVGSRGKEECWYILDAEPGAALAIGLTRDIDADHLRQAAQDGSIEELLEYHPVSSGDFFYLPAGTIHAIGPGISLIEIQQNSDITYRLYDYGRPRELHLEEAVGVAERGPYGSQWHRKVAEAGHDRLVNGPHFVLDRVDGSPDAELVASVEGRCLLIPLSGAYNIAGATISGGQCGLAQSAADISWDAKGQALLARSL